MKISFCTTCMGRAEHLKQTLPQNIKDNPASEGFDVEFVVLNYNSKDDLHEWMTNDPEMRTHIESGLVRYARTTEPEYFHMAHAKNMAHRLATGDVLCNLDSDNYLGKGFAGYLADKFSQNPNIVVSPNPHVKGLKDRGYAGRVALSKENFMKLSGYEEHALKGYGGDDTDLVVRSARMGLANSLIVDPQHLQVIGHENFERIKNMFNQSQWAGETEKINAYKGALPFTKLMRHFQMYARPVQANKDGAFGLGVVCDIDGQEQEIIPQKPEALSFSLRGVLEAGKGIVKRRGPAVKEKVITALNALM